MPGGFFTLLMMVNRFQTFVFTIILIVFLQQMPVWAGDASSLMAGYRAQIRKEDGVNAKAIMRRSLPEPLEDMAISP